MDRTEIAIASDHAGFDLTQQLKATLQDGGYVVVDLGTDSATASVDYPDYGYAMAQWVAQDASRRGVLICGSGIGISIAANRHKDVRAALCHDHLTAKLARQHNDANVICFGARIIGSEVARDALSVFLATPFDGGRHQARAQKLSHPTC